jgi:hypothetical protein
MNQMPYVVAVYTVTSASSIERINARSGELYGEILTTKQVEYLFAVKSLALFHQFGADAFHCALERPDQPSSNYEV